MRFSLAIKNKKTGVESVCRGEFTDDEWLVLTEFLEFSHMVSTAEIIRKGWRSSSIGWSDARGFYSEDNTPESHIRELLHLLRPFVLQNERTNFYNVLNMISRRMDNEGIRAVLGRWKAGFSGQISQSAFTITANNLVLNSDRAFLLWVNALEYHKDRDKQAELNAALGGLPFEVAKNIFLNGMIEKIDSISRVSKFIWDIGNAKLGDSVGMLGDRLTW
jgi:hypothetical protein